ncbi:MAG: hypothetical protein C0407_07785 [Desulfobacca sp.]|nr:hypothetical protein [Desulfobacca sp.]
MMNLRETGYENYSIARRKSQSGASIQPASSEGRASDFLKDVLSKIDSLNTRSMDSRNRTNDLKAPSKETTRKKSATSSDQLETRRAAVSPHALPNDGVRKLDEGNKGDEDGGQRSEKESAKSDTLSPSKGNVSKNKTGLKEEQDKEQTLPSDGNAGLPVEKGEVSAEEVAQGGAAGLLAQAGESGGGLTIGLADNLPIEKGVTSAQEVAQAGAAGFLGQDGESGNGKSGSSNGTIQGTGNGSWLKEPQKKGVDRKSGVGDNLLVEKGIQSTQGPAQSTQSELLIKAGDSGNEKVGKQNPPAQGIENGAGLIESPKIGDGLKAGIGSSLPVDKEKISLMDPLGSGSKKGSEKDEGWRNEIGKNPTAKFSQSSLLSGKEGEKGNEGSKDLEGLFQGDSLSDPKNSILLKVRDDLKTRIDQVGLSNKDGSQNWDNPGTKGTDQVPTSETIGSFGTPVPTEKTVEPKLTPSAQAQGSLKMVLPPEQTFSIKKHSPSSMEVSLEPDGLGKMNIELKLTDHHLNAQIMVNDSIGKELIEKNLPELLSELGKGGLQIGQFSVSLKNQGRDQNPTPTIQPESRGQPLTAIEAGARTSSNSNHLIHIII